VELPEGATVGDLVEYLHLPADQVKVVFVNNVIREAEYPLADGDELGIFPPVGGG
jgi:molybdopterin converting factor small subunit